MFDSKISVLASEVAQQVKALAIKSDNLSFILGTNMVEAEN